MIKVTIWNEFVQEQLCEETLEKFGFEGMPEDEKKRNFARTEEIKKVHPHGIHQTLKELIEEDEEFKVCHIATLEMEECGLQRRFWMIQMYWYGGHTLHRTRCRMKSPEECRSMYCGEWESSSCTLHTCPNQCASCLGQVVL